LLQPAALKRCKKMEEPPKKDDVEYWRWQEYHRIMPAKKWKNKDLITAGVDVGSVGSKAAIMIDGEIYSWGVMRTGSNSPDSAKKVLSWAMEGTDLKLGDFKYIVGTGYGRVNVPMANKAITEIACHAKGANYIWGPSVRTVLDVGGQDIKAIRCDDTGRVTSFLMNDKCAAGTGRGMEVFSDLLKIPIEQIGEFSLRIDEEPSPVSCTCVAFAKTEAMGLLRKGWSKEKVLAAYTRAMAVRMGNLINRVGLEKELVITGGQSKNIGIVSRIENILNVKCLPAPNWRENGLDPMVAGAIGAALLGKALYEKSQKS
jgi:bzd-type benzoyl-CoA reductase Q subunit